MKSKRPGRTRKISRSAATSISRALTSGISMVKLARLANVSRSTLYQHFKRTGVER
jgi:AcrR family transcriptional regulator